MYVPVSGSSVVGPGVVVFSRASIVGISLISEDDIVVSLTVEVVRI